MDRACDWAKEVYTTLVYEFCQLNILSEEPKSGQNILDKVILTYLSIVNEIQIDIETASDIHIENMEILPTLHSFHVRIWTTRQQNINVTITNSKVQNVFLELDIGQGSLQVNNSRFTEAGITVRGGVKKLQQVVSMDNCTFEGDIKKEEVHIINTSNVHITSSTFKNL